MNSFGRIFRISIFGESHGPSVGVVIDGCPPGIPIKPEDFTADLARRKSGAKGTTPRIEGDHPMFMSGLFNGFSTGAPITIMFENTNTRSGDYSQFKEIPRPGHADFVASKKFNGFEDYRGGGHFSARVTLGLVAAGIIAKKIIDPIQIEAKLVEAGGMTDINTAIDKAIADGDTIGGIIECRATNMPVGIGEPYFDSLESALSHMMFSIPAVKGIEFGSGFEAAKMKGSEHNDWFTDTSGKTRTNHAGGINGGISNGNDLVFRIPIKPTSSTSKQQQTMNFKTGQITDFVVQGRHDACVALRAPVIVECATAIVLADMKLLSAKM
ncbi:MAG TPA: chorismate synthase [Bacteroidales bacterium]|nr:chorismate synthase [Bacteroidales bacterium]